MNEIEGPIELARLLKQKGASLSTARRAPSSETWYTLRMADHDVSPKRKSHLMKRVLIGSALVLLVVLVVTGIQNRYHQRKLFECKTNLRDLATSMEMYSTDWNGHYPTNLEKLTPKYIEKIPVCPSSQHGYKVILGPDAPGNEPKFEDYFYLCCEGLNHEEAGAGRDQPAFDQMYLPPDP